MAQIRRWIFKTTFPTMISTNSHDLQYPRTRRSIHSPGCLHQRFLQLLLAVISVVVFGCSSSSDWDVQWQEITEAIEAGNIQEAKTRLSGLLPQVQQEGPKNVHYAQVIFQLGIIAQHEGQEKQAESYFWEALTLWAQSVGPEHPHMASTLSALADLFEKRGNMDNALPLLKRAAAIEEKAWGQSDSRRLPTLLAYHQLLLKARHTTEAQRIQTDISHLQDIHSLSKD